MHEKPRTLQKKTGRARSVRVGAGARQACWRGARVWNNILYPWYEITVSYIYMAMLKYTLLYLLQQMHISPPPPLRAARPDTPPRTWAKPEPPTPLPSIWVRLAWPTTIDRQIAIFCVTSCTDYSYPIANLSDDFEKGASGQNK